MTCAEDSLEQPSPLKIVDAITTDSAFVGVIPQTRDEKIAMYMKLTRRELAEMLTTANEHVDRLSRQQQWQTEVPQKPYAPPSPYVGTTWSPLNNLSRTPGELPQ